MLLTHLVAPSFWLITSMPNRPINTRPVIPLKRKRGGALADWSSYSQFGSLSVKGDNSELDYIHQVEKSWRGS